MKQQHVYETRDAFVVARPDGETLVVEWNSAQWSVYENRNGVLAARSFADSSDEAIRAALS
jgi:hypothetical protein